MTITTNVDGTKTTLVLEGWLDTQAAPVLHEELNKHGVVEDLVLDFSEVEYMASSGLREVVAAFKSQSTAGKAFSVMGVCAEVMDVFQLTGVDKKISITAK